jgi:hypothetical protein
MCNALVLPDESVLERVNGLMDAEVCNSGIVELNTGALELRKSRGNLWSKKEEEKTQVPGTRCVA